VPESKSKRSRYTPPPAKKPPPSPTWYVALTLAFFVVGVLIIIGNYMQILPGLRNNASNTYLGIGLGTILVGFVLAMRLR
jgi:hypothetical protein